MTRFGITFMYLNILVYQPKKRNIFAHNIRDVFFRELWVAIKKPIVRKPDEKEPGSYSECLK